MHDYDPRGERATRDIVSRAMYREILAGRTNAHGGLYLAMGHLGADNVRRQFKGMVERCADMGFDLAGGQVPVVPTAHYMMGGVVFRPDGSTALQGLFAAGEDTGGVHGANRLGGNGVANSTVFGGIAGDSMARYVPHEGTIEEPDAEALEAALALAHEPFRRPPAPLNPIRDALHRLMWDKAGILRDAKGLAEAEASLAALAAGLRDGGVPTGRGFNLAWQEWLNLDSLILVSQAIVAAAAAREESRGAHWREDFRQSLPEDQGLSSTIVTLRDGRLALGWQKVRYSRVQPGQSLLAAE
jgi:fumarate reductase flavoprotein subunit